MLAFTRRLIAFRREHPVFRRRAFLTGEEHGSGLPDVWWFRPDGHKMTNRDWQNGGGVLGMFLNGEEIPSRTPHGERIVDDSFLVLFNAHHEDVTFTLPTKRFGERWRYELDTADPEPDNGEEVVTARQEVVVTARSLVVLRRDED
jgi:glycogen operon protein